MIDLLFNSAGRIEKQRFFQGMVVVTVASILVVLMSIKLYQPFGLLHYALIFPYICVYGKRLHDAGQTALWVLAIWLAANVIQIIISAIFHAFSMSAEQHELWRQAVELFVKGDSVERVRESIQTAMFASRDLVMWSAIISITGGNIIMAAIIGCMKSDAPGNGYD